MPGHQITGSEPVRQYIGPVKKKPVQLSPSVIVSSETSIDYERYLGVMGSNQRWKNYRVFRVEEPLGGYMYAHLLWGMQRPELVKYAGRFSQRSQQTKLRNLILEVLGLKEPTWRWNYDRWRKKVWFKRGELVNARFGEHRTKIPCLVVSEPALSGRTGNVILLRTIDYLPEDEKPGGPDDSPYITVYPIVLPDGTKRSVALPLIRSLNNIDTLSPWSPRHVVDMTEIDERLEELLASANS